MSSKSAVRQAISKADISLSEFAKTYQKNEKYLGRLFTREMGMSYAEYKKKYRLELAKTILIESDGRIIDSAYECGFTSISYFNRSFRKKYEMAPTEFRAKKRSADNVK